MSEKRFTSKDYTVDYYTEIVDNEKELDPTIPNPSQRLLIGEAVDLLNEQDREIKQLKKEKENFELIIKDRLKFLKRGDVRILGGVEVRELEWVLSILSEKMYVNYDKRRTWKNDK